MDPTSRTLRARRLLAFIALVMLVTGVTTVALVHYEMRKFAIVEADDKAKILIEHNHAIQRYYTLVLRPNLMEITKPLRTKEFFDPVWMSATYAVREIGKIFGNQFGMADYYYKESAINARSPENEADDYERAFLETLQADSQIKYKSEIRYFYGKPFAVTMRRGVSLWKPACMRCHSTPDAAPQDMVNRYGSVRSFHRNLGELLTVSSIRIPLSKAFTISNQFALRLSMILLAFLGFFSLILFWAQKLYLFDPLSKTLKKREAALKRSEEKYRDLYDNAPDMFVSVDAKTATIVECNRTLVEVSGYTKQEIIGRSIFDMYTPDSAEYARTILFPKFVKTGVISAEELKIKRKDGSNIDVSLNTSAVRDEKGNIIYSRSVWRDISEKKRLEAQLQQSEKMKSIGTLASGVAHEINNPINGIMNYAQLIVDRIAPDNPLSEFAGEIIHETERVAKIVRNLLTFAREEREVYATARMIDIVASVQSLIETVIRRDQITIEINVPDDLPRIKCQKQQIQQVLVNLITNARDALNDRYPEYDENKKIIVSSILFRKGGKSQIRTTVEDHGTGIEIDIQDRMFDPFFTTKPREIGTGLGLSISYGIVKKHHGELTVETEPGQYTRFHMDLPVDNGRGLETNA